jgi:transcriptional regulator with PAS, ATPase and Fis domain
MTIQEIKNRFGIIGNSLALDRAIDVAQQVAPTNLSVLITGESGVGKEVFSKIIHQLSTRKHGPFIAVNCGAIPEGTIDSELFGHEKGSFTGATDARKGYFEVANGGTIFLDEVADLPLQTQVRLLRVLETGEFIKVGSSKVQKTDVRIVGATNINFMDAIQKGKFREDLYYRLNSVPIIIPPLRERPLDIELIFRKFAVDFAEKYRMPATRLSEDAKIFLESYSWPGNIRQLRNITEQISILEKEREISIDTLKKYIPKEGHSTAPILFKGEGNPENISDREIIYKFLYDMKKDIVDLKKLMLTIMQNGGQGNNLNDNDAQIIKRLYEDYNEPIHNQPHEDNIVIHSSNGSNVPVKPTVIHHEVEESLSLDDREMELITKALQKHRGKRKSAARELGISERTLYRKIKEYNIKE